MLDSLWSLSYLSTKYSTIARVSLGFCQSSTRWDRHGEDVPDDEIVVVMIDDGGDATVWIDLQIIWTLLLAFVEVEVDRFVRQPEFFEDDGGFPEARVSFRTTTTLGGGQVNAPAVGSTLVGVQSELLSMGHDEPARV